MKEKDKERKRHRDSGSSRHHHHKKPKDSSKVVLVEDSDQTVKNKSEGREGEVLRSSEHGGGVEGCLVKVNVPPRELTSSKACPIVVCKRYAEKVFSLSLFYPLVEIFLCIFFFPFIFLKAAYSQFPFVKVVAELENLEKYGLAGQFLEVEGLKKKLEDLTVSESSLRNQLSDMTRQHQTDQDKISSVLSENSRLITESDALAATVKTQNGELVEARRALSELDLKHSEAVRSFCDEKDNLKKELEETKVALGDLEEESLKLFEEGYRECWSRGDARGLDMEPDKYETYLGEVKDRIKKGVGEAGKSSVMGNE